MPQSHQNNGVVLKFQLGNALVPQDYGSGYFQKWTAVPRSLIRVNIILIMMVMFVALR